jgi:transposase
MRAVMNGVMYILSTGCQWRYIPKDFPPRSTLPAGLRPEAVKRTKDPQRRKSDGWMRTPTPR